jgi:hypothetical protein
MTITSYIRAALVGIGLFTGGCTHLNVAAYAVDAEGLKGLHTFALMAPEPSAAIMTTASSNGADRASAVVMDMNPMLATSLVGNALRQDIQEAFDRRGYRLADTVPDFYVAYYAGTGEEVDTRAHRYKYHRQGERTEVQTTTYPAGTVIVDVVSAKTDFVLWRGTATAEIPSDPEDYARLIHVAVKKVVANFPRACDASRDDHCQ